MPRLYKVKIPPTHRTKGAYKCRVCGTELTAASWIISKNFHGKGGPAYLVDNAVNTYTGPPEERELMSGAHVVADVFCIDCQEEIGWTYIDAHKDTEKYKVGKYVLELVKMEEIESHSNPY